VASGRLAWSTQPRKSSRTSLNPHRGSSPLTRKNVMMMAASAPDLIGTPAAWCRGGTSNALFVLRQDLPITDPDQLDAWILAAFGSPDCREIDGIGGADLTTSKFAMLSPSTRQHLRCCGTVRDRGGPGFTG
jgi:2-methylaconitate cis-trans-isomerase PrpF